MLLAQVGHAAWKGGPDNRGCRAAAAAEKIAGMRRQAAALGARTVIPLAGFVRFAHEDTGHLDDAANRPRDVPAVCPPVAPQVVATAPGETQDRAALAQDPASLGFWDAACAGLAQAPMMGCESAAGAGGRLCRRMAKGFAIGNRNAMGLRLGPGLALNARFIALALARLSAIGRRLAARRPARARSGACPAAPAGLAQA